MEMGEPSLVETVIGEECETSSQGSPIAAGHGAYVGPAGVAVTLVGPKPSGKPASSTQVQRSMSDRYSYRVAIFNTSERVEYGDV